MTTSERKWKRRQKLARDIQWFMRVTGATWAQMEKFTGVYYAALRDYFNVRREINEEHFKKLHYMFEHKEEFLASTAPVEKFCVDCGVSIGFHPNSKRCPKCKEARNKAYQDAYREMKRQEAAANTPEKIAKARQTKKERMMFKGMSDNMRKISAIEVLARQNNSDYGLYSPVVDGRTVTI